MKVKLVRDPWGCSEGEVFTLHSFVLHNGNLRAVVITADGFFRQYNSDHIQVIDEPFIND